MNKKPILILLFAILIAMTPMNRSAHALDMEDLERYLYPEPEKTISMNFTDADLENVLKVFSQQSGLNFIASASIADRTINLYLDSVPVEEALERILSAHDLTYELKQGSVELFS